MWHTSVHDLGDVWAAHTWENVWFLPRESEAFREHFLSAGSRQARERNWSIQRLLNKEIWKKSLFLKGLYMSSLSKWTLWAFVLFWHVESYKLFSINHVYFLPVVLALNTKLQTDCSPQPHSHVVIAFPQIWKWWFEAIVRLDRIWVPLLILFSRCYFLCCEM